jgi:hypothetical protein
MAGVLGLIWVSREADCFSARGWTGQISLKCGFLLAQPRPQRAAPAIDHGIGGKRIATEKR